MKPKLKRVIFNILAKDLEASANFYRRIANFEEIYTSDWYVVMKAPGLDGLELGLIDQVSEFTPRHAWGVHEGTYLTLVVDDVHLALETARSMGIEIIQEPVALDYGQTRMLIRDPNGLIIDISTPTEELEVVGEQFVPVARSTAIDQPQPEDRP